MITQISLVSLQSMPCTNKIWKAHDIVFKEKAKEKNPSFDEEMIKEISMKMGNKKE